MDESLAPGLTKFLYDGEQLASLWGTVSVPTGTRVGVGRNDYIVDTVRVPVRQTDYDLYYECHFSEDTGSRTEPI